MLEDGVSKNDATIRILQAQLDSINVDVNTSGLKEELDSATRKSLEFAGSFDAVEDKVSKLQSGIFALLQRGFLEGSQEVEVLKNKLASLGENVDIGALKGLQQELANAQIASGTFADSLSVIKDQAIVVSDYIAGLLDKGFSESSATINLLKNELASLELDISIIEVGKQFDEVSKNVTALGGNIDETAQRTKFLDAVIQDMVRKGFDVSSTPVKSIQAELDALGRNEGLKNLNDQLISASDKTLLFGRNFERIGSMIEKQLSVGSNAIKKVQGDFNSLNFAGLNMPPIRIPLDSENAKEAIEEIKDTIIRLGDTKVPITAQFEKIEVIQRQLEDLGIDPISVTIDNRPFDETKEKALVVHNAMKELLQDPVNVNSEPFRELQVKLEALGQVEAFKNIQGQIISTKDKSILLGNQFELTGLKMVKAMEEVASSIKPIEISVDNTKVIQEVNDIQDLINSIKIEPTDTDAIELEKMIPKLFSDKFK